MPRSRKKAQGKARKAAKGKNAEKANAYAAPSVYRDITSLDDWLSAFEGDTAMKCMHGCDTSPLLPRSEHDCREFALDYARVFLAQLCHITEDDFVDRKTTNSKDMEKCVQQCLSFSKRLESMADGYPDVFKDPNKLKWAISFFHSRGAQDVIDGNMKRANLAAVCAEYINGYCIDSETSAASQLKIHEMMFASDKVVYTYYRKRTTCSCLDAKREQFKDIKKTAKCNNATCPLPDREVECKKILYCSRCRVISYCSPECQKMDWKYHKLQCSHLTKLYSEIRPLSS